MERRRPVLVLVLAACVSVGSTARQAPPHVPMPVDSNPIRQADLERWLGILASDAMEGRANLTESLARAGDYLAAEAKAIGLEPGGDQATYFQNFQITSARSVNRSTLTVEVNGRTRVFRHGEGVEFTPHVGRRRSFTLDRVQLIGYGLQDPASGHDDFAAKDLRSAVAVWLGARGPQTAARSTIAVNEYLRPAAAAQAGAAVLIGPSPAVVRAENAGRSPAPRPRQPTHDFTTARRLDDSPSPPIVIDVVDAEPFYSFLLSGASVSYADLQANAAARAPLPAVALTGVKMTISLDADYTVTRSAPSRNVVAVLRGSDPALADSYLVLGAHYDHVAPKQVSRPADQVPSPTGGATDTIYNGADDNGSGCAALLAVAKAMREGSRPRRTVVFVWFAGEERGLLGSEYHARYGLPADRVAAMLNLDMVGRNESNRAEQSGTVYVLGSDRISTELHNINEDANASLSDALTLDYRYNDPINVRLHYFSSDHFAYAMRGVPIICYTTGLHPDYHQVTDSVERIEFPKLARVAHLVLETAKRLADWDHAPVRDNLGPRVGRGRTGKIAK